MDIKKDTQTQNSRTPALTSRAESFWLSLGKKCERLSTAVYLVTNFLSDTEPMKARLRTLSLELVRDSSIVRYGSTANEMNVLETLRITISETLSLLELAFIVGLVSEMNFSILKREYSSLRDLLEIKKASRESRSDSVLGDTFFGSSFDSVFAGSISIGHSKGQKEVQMSDRKVPVFANTVKQSTTPDPRTPDVAREVRRVRILKLIKDNREVSIKDITNHFPDISEKTIQRELVSLTESGVLKKSGERRWSRYALA